MNFVFKSEVIDYDYFYCGKQDTIIFLHGWGGNKNSFASTINLAKQNFNVLSITLPTINPTFEIWCLFDFVMLVKNLMTLHSITEPIVVCHSFGFRIATILSKTTKLKKIVITGGAGPKKCGVFYKINKKNKLILLKYNKLSFEKLASKDYKNLSFNNKQTFKNVVNLNTKYMLKFSCPILLFWGKFDSETPINIAKKIKVKNKCNLIITKDGHFAYLTQNALFNHCVLEFLND